MKILVLDLEISPTIVTVWSLANNHYINPQNILGNSQILSWAAKWLGDEQCYYSSMRMVGHGPKQRLRMIREIHALLEEADAVITYNGDAFDLKILNTEFALAGLSAPSPYKSIDLLKAVRRRFRFTSNKLGEVGKRLGIGDKTAHMGHEMWLICGDPKHERYEEAWDMMERYNCDDVFLTEDLYMRIRGWIPNHPSFSALENDHVCPNCGSNKLQRRGTAITTTLSYQRFQCKDCGSWSRAKLSLKADRTKQLVSIK